MNVGQWAEIRRLHEVEKLSQRAIAERLGCSRKLVRRALDQETAPTGRRGLEPRQVKLEPFKPRIQAILEQYPTLSAVRIQEKIAQGDGHSPGYCGGLTQLRVYLQSMRPARGRVYQDVTYSPGEAMQIDWGDVGTIQIEETRRKISVFVAVLCYSRMGYIEFTLSQRKAEFYRCLAHALAFFGGSPKKVIFDNLKAAVIDGAGRTAVYHPEFLALCGHYYLEPIACAARDPESKGIVEAKVGYVKRNALAGRDDELRTWGDYARLAIRWRDEVANVRVHDRLQQRPIDRFATEKPALRPLPELAYFTDEVVLSDVRPTAQVEFDSNRYSVPPRLARKAVTIQANAAEVRILHQGEQVASHRRSYGRRKTIADPAHRLEALLLRRKQTLSQLQESVNNLGPEAGQFHEQLQKLPGRTSAHLRRIVALTRLYGRESVLAAIRIAIRYHTYDSAYVETLVHQERRRQSLPAPTIVRPKRQELIQLELDVPDPSRYDRLMQEDDA